MKQKQAAGGKRGVVAAVVAMVALFSAVVMFGYNPFQDNLGTITAPIPAVARWNSMPVQWLLNTATPSNNVTVTGCLGGTAACIQQSLSAAFGTWTGAQVAGQSLTVLAVQYAGASTLTSPDYQDCQNVIGFSDTTSSDFSTGTIAFTQVATATPPPSGTVPFQYTCQSSGITKTCNFADCIADADMEFNPAENFSTSLSPPSGTFSLQSVATHEEGHMLGLDHSGIGHTIMFPFGDSQAAGQQTTLATDDAIGISFLYPSASFSTATGTVSGTVSQSGTAMFGAHVVAVNVSTGDAVTDGLTAPDGTYSLIVPPGSYYVLALPLAPNADSGVLTLDNFSGWACGYGDPADPTCSTVPQNPTSYTGRYH